MVSFTLSGALSRTFAANTCSDESHAWVLRMLAAVLGSKDAYDESCCAHPLLELLRSLVLAGMLRHALHDIAVPDT